METERCLPASAIEREKNPGAAAAYEAFEPLAHKGAGGERSRPRAAQFVTPSPAQVQRDREDRRAPPRREGAPPGATATMSHWHKLGFQAFLAKEIMRKDTLPFAIGMGFVALMGLGLNASITEEDRKSSAYHKQFVLNDRKGDH